MQKLIGDPDVWDLESSSSSIESCLRTDESNENSRGKGREGLSLCSSAKFCKDFSRNLCEFLEDSAEESLEDESEKEMYWNSQSNEEEIERNERIFRKFYEKSEEFKKICMEDEERIGENKEFQMEVEESFGNCEGKDSARLTETSYATRLELTSEEDGNFMDIDTENVRPPLNCCFPEVSPISHTTFLNSTFTCPTASDFPLLNSTNSNLPQKSPVFPQSSHEKSSISPNSLIKKSTIPSEISQKVLSTSTNFFSSIEHTRNFLIEKLAELIPADLSNEESISHLSALTDIKSFQSTDEETMSNLSDFTFSSQKLENFPESYKNPEELPHERPVRKRIKPIAHWRNDKLIYDKNRNLVGVEKSIIQPTIKKKKPEKKTYQSFSSQNIITKSKWQMEKHPTWKQALLLENSSFQILSISLRSLEHYSNLFQTDSILIILQCAKFECTLSLNSADSSLQAWDNTFIPKFSNFAIKNQGKSLARFLLYISKN